VSHGGLLLCFCGRHGGTNSVCYGLSLVGSDWFWSGGGLSNPCEAWKDDNNVMVKVNGMLMEVSWWK